jgi:hypothetical protein
MTILDKLISWSVFLILATPGSLQAQERSRFEIEKSCLQAVQGFYNKFVGKGPKYPSAVLSRELHRQLKEDNENKMDAEGHIVGLDFDPIAAGNDICTRYKVGRVWRRGDRYFVEVFCFWENKKEEDEKMVHELTLNRGRWLIMNIHYYHYEKGKPAEHSDLLSMLKVNQEERRKKPK